MHKYLFIHQNFPGQFKHLAPALAAQGHEVIGLGMNQPTIATPGVRYFRHDVGVPDDARPPTQLKDLYGKVLCGESAAQRLYSVTAIRPGSVTVSALSTTASTRSTPSRSPTPTCSCKASASRCVPAKAGDRFPR